MDKLLEFEETEVIFEFELGRKCKTTIHLKNLMQTVDVAFKVQTTAPHKFAVNPPSGFIAANASYSFDVILKPRNDIPKHFPVSKDIIVVKSVPAVNIDPTLRVPKEWFASREAKGTWDDVLNVVYTGAFLLRTVVEKADAQKLQKMVKLRHVKTYVNELDKDSGKTALHIAAASGNVDMVKLLVKLGADKACRSLTGQTPIHEAVVCGNHEVVVALLDGLDLGTVKDSRGWSPLHLAAARDSFDIVCLLMEREMDPDVRDDEGMTPLHVAATHGHARCVRRLLEGNANVDAVSFDGCTALFRAASGGYVEVVEVLLHFDANRNVLNKIGQIPADVALENGHMEIVELLEYGDEMLDCARAGEVEEVVYWLEKGVRVDFSDQFGWTALHCAALKGHAELVTKLLQMGAAVDAKDSEGHTPLHCAVYGGRSDIVEILVQAGADINAETVRHATALTIARISNVTLEGTPFCEYLSGQQS